MSVNTQDFVHGFPLFRHPVRRVHHCSRRPWNFPPLGPVKVANNDDAPPCDLCSAGPAQVHEKNNSSSSKSVCCDRSLKERGEFSTAAPIPLKEKGYICLQQKMLKLRPGCGRGCQLLLLLTISALVLLTSSTASAVAENVEAESTSGETSRKARFLFPSSEEENTRNVKISAHDTLQARSLPPATGISSASNSSEDSSRNTPIDGDGAIASSGTGQFPDTNGRSLSRDSGILMETLRALSAILPRNQTASSATTQINSKPVTVAEKTNTPVRQGFDGFSFTDLMPGGLRALEGLDDLLRSTVPRFDRFNCLERVMCEIAAPLEDEESGIGNDIYDGVQTLQQLGDSSLLPDYQHDSLQEPLYATNQFISPHRQQFLQHQQHQQNLIQQQVQQLQGNQLQQLHGQHPQVGAVQRPVVPPLPYYVPTPVERQNVPHDGEYLISRGKHSEEKQEYPDNSVRRDEPYKVPYREPHQHNPYKQPAPSPQQQTNPQHHPNLQHYQHQYRQNQNHYQQQNHPSHHHYQQQQRLDQSAQQPFELQQSSQHRPQYSNPPKKRRVPAWRRFVNGMFGLERPRRRTNGPRPARRGRRDTETTTAAAKKSSRRGSRKAKINPMWESSSRKAKSKTEGPSSVKTLTREDLKVIKARIEAINKQVLKDATLNGTTTVNGKRISSRRARFLDSFVNGWSAKTFLGLLDQLMDGYSFHPYTHAAYMGYTGRAGTCQSMYPRCPDSTSDWLDFMNNFHRYFPEGMPFRDNLPWPLNLLVP
ncbi:hypothetical protein FHG87_014207 [Trinorchestia longiramus]|nr:hypothetical protein FHG87_014207 [Trinorchestia longiramus]